MVAFVGVIALIVVLPGPDIALVSRTDRGAAVETALRINAGLVVWAVAATLGIAALLHPSAPAFTLLKLVVAAWWRCAVARRGAWFAFGELRGRRSCRKSVARQ